jgi:hypothetical protein
MANAIVVNKYMKFLESANGLPGVPRLLASDPNPVLPPWLPPEDDDEAWFPDAAASVGIIATIVRSIAAVVADGA